MNIYLLLAGLLFTALYRHRPSQQISRLGNRVNIGTQNYLLILLLSLLASTLKAETLFECFQANNSYYDTVRTSCHTLQIKGHPTSVCSLDSETYIISAKGHPTRICKKKDWPYKQRLGIGLPITQVTIRDENTSDEENLPSGGGGGSFFDDHQQKRPRPRGFRVPFVIETLSNGLMPAGLLSFATNLNLPDEPMAEVLYRHDERSDHSHLMTILTANELRIFRRNSLFGDWQIVWQESLMAEDDSIYQNPGVSLAHVYHIDISKLGNNAIAQASQNSPAEAIVLPNGQGQSQTNTKAPVSRTTSSRGASGFENSKAQQKNAQSFSGNGSGFSEDPDSTPPGQQETPIETMSCTVCDTDITDTETMKRIMAEGGISSPLCDKCLDDHHLRTVFTPWPVTDASEASPIQPTFTYIDRMLQAIVTADNYNITDNWIFSPPPVALLLAILHLAVPNRYEEVKKTLNQILTEGKKPEDYYLGLNAEWGPLFEYLASYTGLYSAPGVDQQPCFIEQIRKLLPLGELDAREHIVMDDEIKAEINQIVSDRTNGLIPEALDPDVDLSQIIVAIFNVIYLKESWKLPFRQRQTKPHQFTGVTEKSTVQMMSADDRTLGVANFALGNLKVKAIQLELNGGLSFVAAMVISSNDTPYNELTSEERVRAYGVLQTHMLKYANFKHLTTIFENKTVDTFKLPRFKVEKTTYLINVLADTGLKDLFDPSHGDLFSNMIICKTNQCFSECFQKCVGKVNEKGVECAAFTFFCAEACSMITKKIVIDHSFVAVIARDTTPIFYFGVANPPEDSEPEDY